MKHTGKLSKIFLQGGVTLFILFSPLSFTAAVADQVTDVYGVSTPEDAWAYFKLPNAGHGFDTTYVPTRSDVSNSQFLSFVVTPATGAWGGAEFFEDEDTVFVFATVVQSSRLVTIPLVWTGDDGHSVFVNGDFVGGGFGEDVPFDLTIEPGEPVKLELVGYNGPGPWVFHLVRRDTGLPLTSTPGVTIEASTEDVPTCLQQPAGLTGWWPGDGSTEEIISGRNAILQDDATFGPGLVDQAFILDGDEDFVEVPHDPALNVGTGDFTIDLWVNFNDTAGEQVLVEKWIQRFPCMPCEGWSFTKLEGDFLHMTLFSGDGSGELVFSDALMITPGTWHHFAARRQGGEVTLFMNGAPVASGAFSGDLDSTSSLKFGHRGSPSDTPGSEDERGFFLNGRIDEVELSVGRALSDAEILAIFNAGSAGKCKDIQLCTLSLETQFTDDTLALEFTLGTQEPVTWNVWLTAQNEIIRLLSLPLSVLDPPVPVPFTLPFVPPLGTVGFLTTLTTPDQGIICSDFTTVDTGPVSEDVAAAVQALQDVLLKRLVK